MPVRYPFAVLALLAIACAQPPCAAAAESAATPAPASSIPLNPDDPTIEEWKHPRDMHSLPLIEADDPLVAKLLAYVTRG